MPRSAAPLLVLLSASDFGGNVFTLGAAGAGGAHGTLGQPAGAAGQRIEYRKL